MYLFKYSNNTLKNKTSSKEMICLGQIILQLIECHKQAEFNKLIRVTAGDKFLYPFWSRHGNIFLRDFSESHRRASKCVELISRQNFSLSDLCVVEIEPVLFTGHRSTFPEHLLGKQPKNQSNKFLEKSDISSQSIGPMMPALL